MRRSPDRRDKARPAKPRRRNHHSDPPRSASTRATAIICSSTSMSDSLQVVSEVGDSHSKGVFDHHDLARAAEHAADIDIDVFAGAAPGSDYAAFFELEHLARRHD